MTPQPWCANETFEDKENKVLKSVMDRKVRK